MSRGVFIIGNGFDLDLDLKTSYSHFMDSDIFKSLLKKNHFAKYLNNKREELGENWIDIENEIKEYLKGEDWSYLDKRITVSQLSVLFGLISGIFSGISGIGIIKLPPIIKLIELLHWQETIAARIIIVYILSGLLSFLFIYIFMLSGYLPYKFPKIKIAGGVLQIKLRRTKYEKLQIKKKYKSNYKELVDALQMYLRKLSYSNINKNSFAAKVLKSVLHNGEYYLYTFNYTDFQKILEALEIKADLRNDIDFFQVHGSIENRNIILGVEDEANIDKKCFGYVIKSMNEHFISRDVRGALSRAKDIIIFGHSLGETDYIYFDEFFKEQANLTSKIPTKKYIRIFTWNESSRFELLKRLSNMNHGQQDPVNALIDLNDFRIYKTSENPDIKEVICHFGNIDYSTIIKEDIINKETAMKNGIEFTTPRNTKYKYFGEIRNNKPYGFGKAIYANGDEYMGEWEDGLLSGKGYYIGVNGSYYFGNWEENKRDGFGINCDPTTKKIEFGNYKENRLIEDFRKGNCTICYGTKGNQMYSIFGNSIVICDKCFKTMYNMVTERNLKKYLYVMRGIAGVVLILSGLWWILFIFKNGFSGWWILLSMFGIFFGIMLFDDTAMSNLFRNMNNNSDSENNTNAIYNAYVKIGTIHNGQKEYDKAIECYDKAIELQSNADIYNKKGIVYANKEAYDEAIKCYQKAIDLQPDYRYAYYNMGLAYGKKGYQNNKIECFQNAAQLGDTDAIGWLSRNGFNQFNQK